MQEEPLQGRKILVTGASGFIGAHLTKRLVESGALVHAVAGRRAPGVEAGPTWHRVDIADAPATRSLIEGVRPEIVYHLAGFVSGVRELSAVMPSLLGNLVSTVNVLTAATELGCRRVVLASSLEEPEPDAQWAVPSSPYAASKYAASTYARMFHALYGTPVVQLRTFIVYGPGQPDQKKVIPYVARALLRGEVPRLSSGARPVDWVYLEDVVEAFVAAARVPGIEGRSCEIGSGTLTTVREVVEELVRIIGPDTPPAFGSVPDRPLEQVRCAQLAEARDLLGWSPRTALADGLRRTVEWHQAELRTEAQGATS